MLDTLEVLKPPLMGTPDPVSASWEEQGRKHRVRTTTVPDLAERLSKCRFNELELSWVEPEANPRSVVAPGSHTRAVMYLSPTNALWSRTKEWRESVPKGELIYGSTHSSENWLLWNEIESFPTFLEVYATLREPTPGDAFAREISEALLAALAQSPGVFNLCCGSADLIGGWPRVPASMETMSATLRQWPRAAKYMARRFDRLHKIVVGPSQLCIAVSKKLGSAAELIGCPARGVKGGWCALYIGRRAVNADTSQHLVKPHLLPRTRSTAHRQPDPSKGEFGVDDRNYFTYRRYQELAHRGFFKVSFGEQFVPWHLVQPSYCKRMGIDPSDMLVVALPSQVAGSLTSSVEARFAHLPESTPLYERVWEAHIGIWIHYNREAIGLLEKLYFRPDNGHRGHPRR